VTACQFTNSLKTRKPSKDPWRAPVRLCSKFPHCRHRGNFVGTATSADQLIPIKRGRLADDSPASARYGTWRARVEEPSCQGVGVARSRAPNSDAEGDRTAHSISDAGGSATTSRRATDASGPHGGLLPGHRAACRWCHRFALDAARRLGLWRGGATNSRPNWFIPDRTRSQVSLASHCGISMPRWKSCRTQSTS